MRSYDHFTLSERQKLVSMLKDGKSLREIASILERNVSSISREIKRSTADKQVYDAEHAVVAYLKRRRSSVRRPVLSEHPECLRYVQKSYASIGRRKPFAGAGQESIRRRGWRRFPPSTVPWNAG